MNTKTLLLFNYFHVVCSITASVCSNITTDKQHVGTQEQTANMWVLNFFFFFLNNASTHESHNNISGERLEGPVLGQIDMHMECLYLL